MSPILVTVCFCFTDVLSYQPLPPGYENISYHSPTERSEPVNQENGEKDLKENVEPQKKDDEFKEETLIGLNKKTTSTVRPPNTTAVESVKNQIDWLNAFLSVQKIDTNVSQHVNSDKHSSSTTVVDKKTVFDAKFNETKTGAAGENGSLSKEGLGEPNGGVIKSDKTPTTPVFSVNDNSHDNVKSAKMDQTNSVLVVMESEPTSSCDSNPLGNYCTYILATSSILYVYHLVQSF